VALGFFAITFFDAATAEARCRKKEDDATTPYRQLTWDDFKGAWTEKTGPAAAYISSGMNLYDAQHLAEETADGWVARLGKICLFAQMAKYESAVRPGTKKEKTLAHEQGHFDLTEFHTRRLYKTLLELETRGQDERQARHELRTAVDKIYKEAVRDWQAEESTYDSETNHGIRKGKQKGWLAKIEEMLDSLPPAGRGRGVPGTASGSRASS